VQERDIVPIER